jgi:CheY-specific phosphatase CheX
MGNLEVQRNSINRFVLDIVIGLVGEVEGRPR